MAQSEVLLKNPYDVLGVAADCPQSAITKVRGPRASTPPLWPQLPPSEGAGQCAQAPLPGARCIAHAVHMFASPARLHSAALRMRCAEV